MGQGQSEIAIEKLKSAAERGDWLCLKNLHLMTFWLPTLEKELQSLDFHEGFRLWLTAEPHSKFSPTLAELCLKVNLFSRLKLIFLNTRVFLFIETGHL